MSDKVTTRGMCPKEDEILGIIDWARENELPGLYATRELHKAYPPAFSFREVASGVLIAELSKHNKEYLLWFKPQIKEIRSWAGNPDKSSGMDKNKKLHPRKSFEKWEQQIQGKSAPWTMVEEERAGSLAKTAVSIQLKCQAQKLSKLNLQLQHTLQELGAKNAQLEDFTRIASHNLLSPLNTITSLIDLYKKEKDFPMAQLALEKIDIVSAHMYQTLLDLHQILQISSGQDLEKLPIDIGQVIEKEKQSLANQIQKAGASIQTHLQVAVIVYPRIYFESIIHNLLSNAIKYASSERKPIVEINTWEENEKIHIEVKDYGIGIDLQKHGDKLFGLYKRFHQRQDSRGLGLYRVKRQIEALAGKISVESEEGKGTSFRIVLKKLN